MVRAPSRVLYSHHGGTNHHNPSTYGAGPCPRMLHISLGQRQPEDVAHPSQEPWYLSLPLLRHTLALPGWLAQPTPPPFQPWPAGFALAPLPVHDGAAYEQCLQ